MKMALGTALIILVCLMAFSLGMTWVLLTVIGILVGFSLSFKQVIGLWIAWILIKGQLKKYRRG